MHTLNISLHDFLHKWHVCPVSRRCAKHDPSCPCAASRVTCTAFTAEHDIDQQCMLSVRLYATPCTCCMPTVRLSASLSPCAYCHVPRVKSDPSKIRMQYTSAIMAQGHASICQQCSNVWSRVRLHLSRCRNRLQSMQSSDRQGMPDCAALSPLHPGLPCRNGTRPLFDHATQP